MKMFKSMLFIFSGILFFSSTSLFAKDAWENARFKTRNSAEGHAGRVMAIASDKDGKSFFSCGSDGYVVRWSENGNGDRYQLSSYPLSSITVNPAGTDFAVWESEGTDSNVITVFDWNSQTKKFSKRFSDKITGLSYSQKGSYLFVSTQGVSSYYILDSKNGTILKKISDISSPICMIKTGASEKSAVFYLKSGMIVYYNLVNFGSFKKFSTEGNLYQTTLFSGNKYLAGEKNGFIYIIDALTGKTLSRIPSKSPTILEDSESSDILYYLEKDAKGTTSLKSINADDSFGAETAGTVSISSGEAIASAARTLKDVIIGTTSGNIYSLPIKAPSSEAAAVSKGKFDKISDIAHSSDGSFYFISGKNIYKSSYNEKKAELVVSDQNQTNIEEFGSNFILWSKGTKRTVQYLNSSTGKVSTLFTPKAIIQSLKICDGSVVYVQGRASVYSFDINSGKLTWLYSGTSIEDALVYEKNLYVAKAKVGTSDSAFVKINLKTRESVPVFKKGFSSCGLSSFQNAAAPYVYGILLSEEDNAKTSEVFAYDIKGAKSEILFKADVNDLYAQTFANENAVFTNIGKSNLCSYNEGKKEVFVYRRGLAVPQKAEFFDDGKIAVVNTDGSLTWYSSGNRIPLADWCFSKDGNFKIF